MKYDIICEDLTEFVEICAMLVRQGIEFEACARSAYIIHCTGGF